MSKLALLINKLCPSGVPHVLLGEIVEIANRGVNKVDTAGESSVQLLNYMDVYRNRTLSMQATSAITTASENQIVQCDVRVGDVFITPSSETREDLAHASVVVSEMPNTVYSYHVMRLRIFDTNLVHPKFLAYQFRSASLQNQIIASSNGITRFGLTKPKWEALKIQLPPIEVQQEIVTILDTFTELIEELEAELEARKSQYEIYRRNLLVTVGKREASFRSTLGEISLKVTSGSTPLAGSERFYQNGTIPWLRTAEVKFNEIWQTEIKVTEAALKETGIKWVPENCVIIAISGATAGRSAVNKIPLTTNQHCCNFEIDPDKAHFRFVYHWVASHYQDIKSFGRGVRSDLSAVQLKEYPIALPSLNRQVEVSNILDKFDQLTSEESIGLPAEIAARRRQFEYYRNELLNFKDSEVA